ncbi:unnamed protein product [Peniophora sp. CBMAI 1063]|nr:unnamed protein product [Peniophora sp. CBMAI 1063]
MFSRSPWACCFVALWSMALFYSPVLAAPSGPSKGCNAPREVTHTTASTYDAYASTSTSLSPTSPASATTDPAPLESSQTVSTAASRPTRAASGGDPRFVVYTLGDGPGEQGLPDADDIKGFNVLALAFWVYKPSYQAQVWSSMSASKRKATKQAYNDAGISVIVSAFGADPQPTTDGKDATSQANNLAQFVIDNDLDGVDVDYEDFDAFDNADDKGAKAINWLITFTQVLRDRLPAGQYTISHAPVAPWFSNNYHKGGYLYIDQQVGSLIDWYNIQFYNQGDRMYTDCDGLINQSGSDAPNTAVLQIAQAGVDMNKIVIGKLGKASDADNGGYMSPSDIASCAKLARDKGWNGGVMSWEYPNADTNWITTARGSTFPM